MNTGCLYVMVMYKGSQMYINLTPVRVITPVRLNVVWEFTCLLSAKCVNLVCNEDKFVHLSVPYITLCDFIKSYGTEIVGSLEKFGLLVRAKCLRPAEQLR